MPTQSDTAPPTSKPSSEWLGAKQTIACSLAAVGCFHLAYAPATSGILALAIVGYVAALMQLARSASKRLCFYSALATAFACYAPQLSFFWGLFGAAAIALWLVLALWIAGFVLLTRVAIGNLGWIRAAFLAPFFWTGLEYFRSELYYLRFSWLNVGYAFAETFFLPWRYLGVYGVGFISAVIGGALLLSHRWQWRKPKPLEWFIIAAFFLFFTSVAITTMVQKIAAPTLIAAGVQLEFPEDGDIVPALDRVLAEFDARSRTNTPSRTRTNLDLIVLPEYALPGEPSTPLKEWCRDHGKFLVIGGKQAAGATNFYNTAFVISTNGEVVFRQVKSVPIQFFKDGLPAAEQRVWNSPWGRIGICICYDLSYTRVTDELIKQGAQLLIVPTMDVVDWGSRQHALHARIAPIRAAEYGVPIFRVASSGISQGVERTGRVLTQASFPGEGEALFYDINVTDRGAVPADRLLALLSVGVTIIFIVRTAVTSLLPQRGDN